MQSCNCFPKYFGISGGSLPAITAIVVILATIFPSQFDHLAPAGEAMALVLMQVRCYDSRDIFSPSFPY